MDIYFPKFNIYQGIVAPNWFKSFTNSQCPDFFFKKNLFDVQSETHLVRSNIVSTGKAVSSCSWRQNHRCLIVLWTISLFRSLFVVYLSKYICKSLLNLAYLWSRARFVIKKKQKCFSLQDHQLAENLILVFGFYEGTNKW